jgi:basic membrane lipoprotein Med (substrate-binding protein (PBP1-ABC) superfamily)
MAVTGTNLPFMMQSNLTLQANFLDVTKPTLTITVPAANQKMTNALVTGIGTASDNWQVTNVWYQLNNGAWSIAATTAKHGNAPEGYNTMLKARARQTTNKHCSHGTRKFTVPINMEGMTPKA